MSFVLDPMAARQRHEDMLREAEEFRLARRVAQANGKPRGSESLLSRMVNLLSRSNRPAHSAGRSDRSLHQRNLVNAKSR